ncbi:uncharacterized protein G2W53_039646 [Senna tora]|uniref:Uncharacterized protein n=1 Tax=Senna tora TaxID=362788 RepID=A0A834W311_9FABA|nr:uncharacterized protein G2W53_039646 [Senna tora]
MWDREYRSRYPTVGANWGAENARVEVMCWWSAEVANRYNVIGRGAQCSRGVRSVIEWCTVSRGFRSRRRNKDQRSSNMMVRRSRRINSQSEANGSAQSERRNRCTRTKKETVKNKLKKMKHDRKHAE